MAPRFAFLRIRRMLLVTTLAVSTSVWAQSAEEKEEGWRKTDQSSGDYVVEPGSKVPLSLINSVSTKHSAEGDRVDRRYGRGRFRWTLRDGRGHRSGRWSHGGLGGSAVLPWSGRHIGQRQHSRNDSGSAAAIQSIGNRFRRGADAPSRRFRWRRSFAEPEEGRIRHRLARPAIL